MRRSETGRAAVIPEQAFPTAVPSAGRWFTPGRFAILLLVFIAAAYPDVIFTGQTFFHRDFGVFGFPLATFYRDNLLRGEIPFWNPLNNCGLPFLAQWNTMVLYPGSLLHLFLPLNWSVTAFCLLHWYLGGFAAYLLARRWTGNLFASATAGIAFAFNGLVLNCLMWPNNIAAFGWMPLVILMTERAWTGRSARAIAWAGLAGAMQMLTGGPEIILFTWLMILALWLSSLPGKPAWKGSLLAGCLVLLIVFALSAVQLFPFLDLLRQSQRHSAYAGNYGSMPIWGWANFIVPLFHSFSRATIYFQDGQYWTSSYYPGIGILTLAFVAPALLPDRRTRVLTFVALAGMVLALGDAGYAYAGLRKVIPGLGFINFPIKFVILPIAAMPFLAASAIAGASDALNQRRWQKAFLVTGAGLGVCALAFAAYALARPIELEQGRVTLQNGLVRIGFLIAFVALLRTFPVAKTTRSLHFCQFALLILQFLDVSFHAPRQNPTAPAGIHQPGLAQFSPPPRFGASRAMITTGAEYKLRVGTTENPQKDYLFYRRGLFDNVNLIEGIAQVRGFYSLYLPHSEQVRELFRTVKEDLPHLEDFLGVSEVTAPDKIVDWQHRDTFLPLVTAGQKPVFAGPAETLGALSANTFNPAAEVFLPAEMGTQISAQPAPRARIRDARFQTQAIEFTVESDMPALAVIAQAFHPAWRARVANRPAPLLRANHAFQAVEVPAGQHRVRLEYVDRPFRWGLALTGGGTLLCLFLFVLGKRPAPATSDNREMEQPK